MSGPPEACLPPRYEPRGAALVGGESWVIPAFDRERGELIALKAVRTGGDAAEARLRSRRELALLVELRHPGLPAGFDAGELLDGTPFHTMAWVPGADVAALTAPCPAAEVLGWLPAIAGALDALHARGLVHGDVSAANVRRTPDGGAVLLDLGFMDRPGPMQEVGGTPAALAPELILEGRRDRRTDWYALGCVLYRALCGRDPFEGPGARQLRAHVEALPTPPRELVPDLTVALEAAVLRLLAKDPADRFADGTALLRALGLPSLRPAGGELLETPLLARETALSALDGMLHGAGGAMWLAGAPGSGRSRLLGVARARALALDLPVLAVVGAGVEAPPLAALAPVIALLAARAPGAPADDVAALLTAAGQGPGLEGARERLRLAAAITELARAALPGGAVWLVDDADRLDPLSHEALACVRRSGGDRPWRWVLAGCPPEGEADEIPLPPLDAATLAQLAAAGLGGPLPARLRRPLVELAGGLPGRARAILAGWLRAGVLVRQEDGWHAGDPALAALPADAVEAELAGLSAGARGLAGLAAVLGESAPLASLEAVADQALPGWPATWGELVARGILTVQAGRYRFAGAGTYLAARAALPPAWRRDLHALAYDQLAAALPDAAGPAELLAAAGQALAGRVARGAPVVVRAVRAALALHEVDRAAALIDQAAGWLAAPGSDVALDLDVLGAQVARARGDVATARAAFERGLLERLEARGDQHLSHHLVTLGVLHQLAGDYAAAAKAYDTAAERARRDGVPEAQLRALLFAGRTAVFQGQTALAGERFAAACELAADPALARRRGWVLGSFGQWLEARGGASRERGMGMLREAVALNLATHDVYLTHEALNNLGNAHLAAGELAAAREAFAACRGIAARFGLANERAFGLINGAAVELEAGALPAALEAARDALASARTQGRRYPEGLALAYMGAAEVEAGEAAAGLAHLDEAAALAGVIANRYLALTVLALRAEAEVTLERLPEAQGAWQEACGVAAETENEEQRGRLDRVGLALAVLAGEGESAARRALTGPPPAHLGHRAQAWYWLGRALTAADDLPGAADAFARADQAATALGLGLLAVEARYRRGLTAPPDEAAAHLTRARDEARAAGRAALAARAAAALAARQGDDVARREALRRLRELAAPLGGSPGGGDELLTAGALARLSALIERLDAAPEPEAAAQVALAALLEATGAERALLVEYDGLAVIGRHLLGAGDADAEAFSRTLAHRVALEGRLLVIEDVAADARLAEAPSVRRLGLRSFVGVPLWAGGRVAGALIADSRRLLAAPGPAARAELESLGTHAARALAASRRLARLQAEGEDARAALALARQVVGRPAPDALRTLLDGALAATGATSAWLLTGPALEVVMACGVAAEAPREQAAWAREAGKPLALPAEDEGAGGWLLLPVAGAASGDAVLALAGVRPGPASALVLEIAGLMAPLVGACEAQGAW